MKIEARIILASGSPRRRELLAQAGYDFTVEVSDADECVVADSPAELVELLSERKAEAVAFLHECEDVIVVGSDTVVAQDGEILGKPLDEEDAARMLRSLSGRTHQVYTGVTLIRNRKDGGSERVCFHECTQVTMRELCEDEIRAYIATGEPMDKAGAYGIQGRAAVFISGICGDYYNVVGLPICHLQQEFAVLL